jgi:hypothetical protein
VATSAHVPTMLDEAVLYSSRAVADSACADRALADGGADKMACKVLLVLLISKGFPAIEIASCAASAAPAAPAPTALPEAILVGSSPVADSGAADDDAPPKKSASPVPTASWPKEEPTGCLASVRARPWLLYYF